MSFFNQPPSIPSLPQVTDHPTSPSQAKTNPSHNTKLPVVETQIVSPTTPSLNQKNSTSLSTLWPKTSINEDTSQCFSSYPECLSLHVNAMQHIPVHCKSGIH
ncbi:hypothetical protein M758_10G111400 [Ceratodon purpureus]|nr:hypothetical protein M758_10G111400 [Ceratodon purpureus]